MDASAPTPQTDDLDPLELQDVEDDIPEDIVISDDDDLVVAVIQEEQELVKDIEKVVPEEEAITPKKASHIIPQHIIDQPLSSDDLMDPGAL